MSTRNLHVLSNAVIKEEHFTTVKSWLHTIVYLVSIYGALSVNEIYSITKSFNKSWITRGKYGGKTVKNTIYSACSTGVKKGILTVVCKRVYSYYVAN